MKKDELVKLLLSLDIAVNEGESSQTNANIYPRIVFWDYYWEDVLASSEDYSTIETYQISFYAKKPRHEKLLELRQKLREAGIHARIAHELIEERGKDVKYWHSYFSVEVLVDE